MKIFLDQQMMPIKTLGRYIKTDCIQLNMQVVLLIIILVILYGFYGTMWQGVGARGTAELPLCEEVMGCPVTGTAISDSMIDLIEIGKKLNEFFTYGVCLAH